jgi:hypothetical protein
MWCPKSDVLAAQGDLTRTLENYRNGLTRSVSADDKGLDDAGTARVRMEVFPLKVSRQRATWPQQIEGEKCWYDPDEAAEHVDEQERALLPGRRMPASPAQ